MGMISPTKKKKKKYQYHFTDCLKWLKERAYVKLHSVQHRRETQWTQ